LFFAAGTFYAQHRRIMAKGCPLDGSCGSL
jgi:hypothetical protein